jgi:HAD superfamily hydrolase (TIGR01509 family)
MVPEMFEVCALSFRIGAMKPSRDIYEAAAELAGVRPEEVFFIDDRQENVVAAKASGFDAVLYSTPQDLALELASRGVELNY